MRLQGHNSILHSSPVFCAVSPSLTPPPPLNSHNILHSSHKIIETVWLLIGFLFVFLCKTMSSNYPYSTNKQDHLAVHHLHTCFTNKNHLQFYSFSSGVYTTISIVGYYDNAAIKEYIYNKEILNCKILRSQGIPSMLVIIIISLF